MEHLLSNKYDFILGGFTNCVSGAYSAILGGTGNCDNGNALTGIYGSGIVASAIPGGLGAFWVNELVVPNMPDQSATLLPPGALYYCTTTNVVYRTP